MEAAVHVQSHELKAQHQFRRRSQACFLPLERSRRLKEYSARSRTLYLARVSVCVSVPTSLDDGLSSIYGNVELLGLLSRKEYRVSNLGYAGYANVVQHVGNCVLPLTAAR